MYSIIPDPTTPLSPPSLPLILRLNLPPHPSAYQYEGLNPESPDSAPDDPSPESSRFLCPAS
jgi:hypothetical protein